MKTAKEWIKVFGDDSVRVGEGLLDKVMSQAEFEREVEKEMGSLPQNIYRNEGIFAGEYSPRTKKAVEDLKKVRKEIVKKTPKEKEKLLEKAIEIKEPVRPLIFDPEHYPEDKNPHAGSTFDSFLEEEGIKKEVEDAAKEKIAKPKAPKKPTKKKVDKPKPNK